MYELVCGSIFDMKCDLIIIPCDNFGNTTFMVREELIGNKIPFYRTYMSPGEVLFRESNGNFTNAAVIGFAASVNAETINSTVEYLQNISKEIKKYCDNNFLHIVNIPLLGTGAGGLNIQTSFETLKSYFENDTSINLRIFAYSQQVYYTLNRNENKKTEIIKNPRVFISYTGDDPDNRKWVKNLACRLRENGVDARIDIFHLKPGQDLPQWMTNELNMADKVLLICDKYYVKKADSRSGGVGWETMIIQGDMMSNEQSNKYICIIRESSIDQGLPIYVRSKYSLHWIEYDISEENFKELMYNLFDCDIEPSIGSIPNYIKENYKL